MTWLHPISLESRIGYLHDFTLTDIMHVAHLRIFLFLNHVALGHMIPPRQASDIDPDDVESEDYED